MKQAPTHSAAQPSSFDTAVQTVRAGGDPVHEAQHLYDALSDEERLGLLDGDQPFWPGLASMVNEGYNVRPYVHGSVERLGIPGTRFVDGPRGCVSGSGTAFPVSMARGATWDVELEERVGEAIGREVRAQGGNFFGGVCINLLRHPAWGRAQETYGDDPFHLGEFGAALTRGVERYAMACVKHYALNSMENARFTVDVSIDDATLHDVYLPHFRRVIDEGASAVMAAYNSVNGEWAGQNKVLLTDILRDQWGFDGITATDFIWGMRDGAAALEAGMDLEEPSAQQRATHLPAQLAAGETSWAAVERSALRILATQLRSYATRIDVDPQPEVMACADHRALAREVATRSMVLLRNEPVDGTPVLPLDPKVGSIAVIGRLATAANLGDHGSSNVRPPSTCSPIEGIRAAYPNAAVELAATDDIGAAVTAARNAEVAIVIAGYTAADEGEYVGSDTMTRPELLTLFPPMPADFDVTTLFPSPSPSPGSNSGTTENADAIGPIMSDGMGGDRASLRLRPFDEELIAAVAAANPRTVVVLVAAGPVITEQWREQVPGLMVMWYAGMEGGHALADVLSGRHNPSGRLPFAVAASEDHLPFFDRDATSITYDRFHGQRLLDRLGVDAAFPHGFGISYTSFSIDAVAVQATEPDSVRLAVTVTNTGDLNGRHVVQVYGSRSTGSYAGEHFLCGFGVVALAAGERDELAVDVALLPLAEWDPALRDRVLPALGDVRLEVGAFAHDPAALSVNLT